MDQCWMPNDHLGLIFLFNYTFYSLNNTDWIANTDIGLGPNNSVIKRLWCILKFLLILVLVLSATLANECHRCMIQPCG